MRTLWVKPGGFLPLDSGGKIRSYQTVKQLARHWPTTVLTFYPELADDKNVDLRQDVEKLITIPLRQHAGRLTGALDYAGALLSGLPFSFQKYCRPQVRRAIEEELKSTAYDLVICDFLLACGAVPLLLDKPKVVFTHNVECRIWERQFKVAPGPVQRFMAKREWKKIEALEHKYLMQADTVLTVSPTDRDEFVSWGIPGGKITSVPTGVDVSFFSPQPAGTSTKTMVFTGSMDWMPNQDGMLFFLESVYPLIVEKVSDVRLKIVGRKPPAKIVSAAAKFPGITVTGWVEDVRPYLAEADLCIVPLRVGSGTRLKIFEAMAMAKAIVSTTIGAEGLPVHHQEDILIADEPADFAARCVELLQDQSQRDRIGAAARSLVETRYSWEAVTRELMQAIENGVKAHRAG